MEGGDNMHSKAVLLSAMQWLIAPYSIFVCAVYVSCGVSHSYSIVSTLERRIRLLHTAQDNSRLRQEM